MILSAKVAIISSLLFLPVTLVLISEIKSIISILGFDFMIDW